jgi:hypothetical protein
MDNAEVVLYEIEFTIARTCLDERGAAGETEIKRFGSANPGETLRPTVRRIDGPILRKRKWSAKCGGLSHRLSAAC